MGIADKVSQTALSYAEQAISSIPPLRNLPARGKFVF